MPLDGTVNIGAKSEVIDGGDNEDEDLDTPQLDWWSKYRNIKKWSFVKKRRDLKMEHF